MTRVKQSPTRGAERALTEAQFQQQIMEYAQLRGWLCAHFRPAMNRRGVWATQMAGDPGFPDLVLARKGVVVFAELKSEKARASADQLAWLEALQGMSLKANVFLWRPSDWDTVVEVLE